MVALLIPSATTSNRTTFPTHCCNCANADQFLNFFRNQISTETLYDFIKNQVAVKWHRHAEKKADFSQSPQHYHFCRTLVVAHCGPIPKIPMTFGSCFCHEHITNSVIGVSQPPVLDCGTTFHLDSGGRDLPLTLSDNL